MADRDARGGREQRKEIEEIERIFNEDTASQEEAAANAQGAEERKEPEQENNLCQARVEPSKADSPRKGKRNETRKVAILLKRVKKDKCSSYNVKTGVNPKVHLKALRMSSAEEESLQMNPKELAALGARSNRRLCWPTPVPEAWRLTRCCMHWSLRWKRACAKK
jgi:hypothetical protein